MFFSLSKLLFLPYLCSSGPTIKSINQFQAKTGSRFLEAYEKNCVGKKRKKMLIFFWLIFKILYLKNVKCELIIKSYFKIHFILPQGIYDWTVDIVHQNDHVIKLRFWPLFGTPEPLCAVRLFFLFF